MAASPVGTDCGRIVGNPRDECSVRADLRKESHRSKL